MGHCEESLRLHLCIEQRQIHATENPRGRMHQKSATRLEALVICSASTNRCVHSSIYVSQVDEAGAGPSVDISALFCASWCHVCPRLWLEYQGVRKVRPLWYMLEEAPSS